MNCINMCTSAKVIWLCNCVYFLQQPRRDQGILVTKPIFAVHSLHAFHDYQNIDCVWNITLTSGGYSDDTTGPIWTRYRRIEDLFHDDVIKWRHFPRYWPFVGRIHRSPVNSPHKGQWRGALMFSLIAAWINGWINNRDTGDLRRCRAHDDVTVMCQNRPLSNHCPCSNQGHQYNTVMLQYDQSYPK